MKRTYLWMLAAVLLLSGCGGGQTAEQAEEPEQTAPAEELGPAPEGLTMELEHDVYDPSLTSYTYFIHNDTDQPTGVFGASYAIQRKDGGGWTDLTMKDGVGWDDIGYTLEYRLVQEVDGALQTAEVSLGESPYTAQTPYGFGPLEDLPERYGAADAAGTGAVIFTDAGTENAEAVGTFLEKASLGIPCQLRTVQDHGESTPMVIDVICENDGFLWRMRSGGTEVAERRLSYIVTDGTDLYLSDGADWDAGERYGDQRVFLVPPLQGTEWVPDVEAMTADRLAWNATRYQLQSADGVWCAALWEEPTAFSVSWQKPGEGSGSSTYDLADWDGLETAITGLAWREDGKLTLKCETADGGTSRLTFDPETETLT